MDFVLLVKDEADAALNVMWEVQAVGEVWCALDDWTPDVLDHQIYSCLKAA